MSSKRLYVVNEIVSTEESYLKALQTVIDLYVNPFSTNGIITPEEGKVLFGNIKDLSEGASSLSTQLQERLKSFSMNDNICDVFLLNKNIFERFGKYIQNYDKASALFDKLTQKRKKFEEFCEAQKEDPRSNNGDIMSFLIFPVQRIPRYILLMKEYIKNTDKEHPDAAIAEQVRRYLDSYAKEVNSVIAVENNKRIMRDFMKKFTDMPPEVKDELLNTPRNLVREGVLLKQCRKAQKERYFFLFNDATIIYGEQEGKKIIFHQKMGLNSVKDVEDSDNGKNGFQIKTPQKSAVVYAKDLEDKKAWVIDLNFMFTGEKKYEFEDVEDDETTAPIWVPDDNVLDCMNCHSKFTFINRRHHCRNCGRVLCSNCTKQKIIIPHLSPKPQRVCDQCALNAKNKKTLEDDSSDVKIEGIAPPKLPESAPPQRKETMKVNGLYSIQAPTRVAPELQAYPFIN
ncbi:Rho/RAC guanine nucleotide exchange factor, putative [Entamoeba invadens IP1]|uniref:Rho/RAC guanine nucleotide exchange factor, putative n=1 Tax=Entamoeba invadens IP1 TaxID=370355 RepID=UPI0002C3E71D|nr:Rho/RAC guanine nucleotide exchange factor, putative [Entamoeba invadens IP1]ELP94237.1 Rho/RAC guanine nucleotide exchange factor, putative [Entamoeba invadens IP1]|eukprot:XP_004261008.1 Rho/RAC guanine nucleotide exchange factor, putative [Entamoeba invadens IP1]